MRVELLISISSLSLGVAAVAGSFFGMNLHSGLEEAPYGLWAAATCTSLAAYALLHTLMRGVRRFHHLQREHLTRSASLTHALAHIDLAFFALRRSGVLADGDDEIRVSKAVLEQARELDACCRLVWCVCSIRT
eukprot:1958189-Pleurochrysis_carterae.AAC.2